MLDTPTATTRSINLVTEVPGPRSRELVARREAAVAAGLYKATPLAVARAEGALVTDVDGNTFLDFVGGIGVLAVGHCPPAVVEAMTRQAHELIHMCALVATYEPYVELCERLNALVPISGPCKTLLGNSGAEAVETAIKIARAATGRQAIIAFEGAYHGRTLLTLSLTSKITFKKTFGPFAPEVYRAPFPYAYHCQLCSSSAESRVLSAELSEPHTQHSALSTQHSALSTQHSALSTQHSALSTQHSCSGACFNDLERMLLTHVNPETVAAVIIEPVQGEGGFIPVPAHYMRQLRALCDKHGIVLIADEVQSGFGRTGSMFAIEQSGVEPDIIVSAKSLAAGMPLSATTGRAQIMDKAHVGGVGGTYGGNPLACAAALATLDIIEQDGLIERATVIGERIRARAAAWQAASAGSPYIGEVRGMGAMIALELVRDPITREPAVQETQLVLDELLQRGVIAMRAGLYTNCIRLLIPLVISDAQLEEGLEALGEALRTIARG